MTPLPAQAGSEQASEQTPDVALDTQPVLPRRHWSRGVASAVIAPLIVLGIVIGIWYLVTYVVLDPTRRFLLPPPQTVFSTAFGQHDNLMTLLNALAQTAEVAMVGLAIAIGIGVLIAVVMSESRHIERGFYPYLVVLQTVPILALVPLIGFWIGFGFEARVIVCILISLFPIIANTLFGLQSPTAQQRELFELHRASRLTRLLKLKLPMALPAMIGGFRISAGLSVVGEIVGGYFFQRGTPDIGTLLDEFTARLNGPMLFGAIIVASLLGVVVFWIFSALGAALVGRWKE